MIFMARSLLLLMLALGTFGHLALADRFSIYTKDELGAFVGKNHSCFLAVAVEDIFHIHSVPTGGIGYSREVLCIGEITTGLGSIKEKSGCGIAIFNAETMNYTPTYDPHELRDPNIKDPFNRIKGSCSAGWREILKTRAGLGQGKSVAELLTVDHELYRGQKLLLSESEEATAWFNNTRGAAKSKSVKAPTGYGQLKFGMSKEKASGYLECKIAKAPVADVTLPADVKVFPCEKFDYDGRSVNGELYFKKGKLARVMLGIGMPEGGAADEQRTFAKNYVAQLTEKYGEPMTTNVDDMFEKIVKGEKERVVVRWLNSSATIDFFREGSIYGAELKFSAADFPRE